MTFNVAFPLFLLLLMPLQAFADGAQPHFSHDINTKNAGTPDPLSDPRYMPCGQECLYKKGNENISFEAAYIMEKLDRLRALKSDGGHESDLKANLIGFCYAQEDADHCFKRYEEAQVLKLHRIRQALVQNQDGAAKLNSSLRRGEGGPTQDGVAPPVFTQEFPGQATGQAKPEYLPQVPFLPKIKDLREIYGNNENLHRLVGDDYQKWVAGILPKPSIDEFVVFERVKRDPSDPQSVDMVVVKMDGDKVVHDQKAYDKAMKIWKAETEDFAAKYKQTFLGKATKDEHQLTPALNGAASEDAYVAARNLMVGAINNKDKTNPFKAKEVTIAVGKSGVKGVLPGAVALNKAGQASGSASKSAVGAGQGRMTASTNGVNASGNPGAAITANSGTTGTTTSQSGGPAAAKPKMASTLQPWGTYEAAPRKEMDIDPKYNQPVHRGAGDDSGVGFSSVSFTPETIDHELEINYNLNP